jgi:hypothetical protein
VGMTLNGCDVSYANSTTPTAGYAFVFAKAGERDFQDPMWTTHSANVRKAGKVLGSYWYWSDRASAATQAALFLQIAGSADLLALDYEGQSQNVAGAKAFIAAVKAAGRECGLYHSASGFPNFGQDWNWVAQWGIKVPSIPWTFWQYSGTGLDRDKFNGDAAALAKLAGSSTGGGNQPGDDVDPNIDIPVVTGTIAANTNVWADRAGSTRLIAGWKGGTAGVYSLPAPGSSVPNMSHGPVALRLDLGTAAAPKLVIGWVDKSRVTLP